MSWEGSHYPPGVTGADPHFNPPECPICGTEACTSPECQQTIEARESDAEECRAEMQAEARAEW